MFLLAVSIDNTYKTCLKHVKVIHQEKKTHILMLDWCRTVFCPWAINSKQYPCLTLQEIKVTTQSCPI